MRLAVIVALVTVSAEPAQALNCYENLGETGCPHEEVFPRSDLRALSCQNLWTVRNGIYDGHGYCFKTEAAKQVFDNSDCTIDDPTALGFNTFEQRNIDNIRRVEKEKGCN